jgi:hypothetical protein
MQHSLHDIIHNPALAYDWKSTSGDVDGPRPVPDHAIPTLGRISEREQLPC